MQDLLLGSIVTILLLAPAMGQRQSADEVDHRMRRRHQG
jgi:hypothetical protein